MTNMNVLEGQQEEEIDADEAEVMQLMTLIAGEGKLRYVTDPSDQSDFKILQATPKPQAATMKPSEQDSLSEFDKQTLLSVSIDGETIEITDTYQSMLSTIDDDTVEEIPQKRAHKSLTAKAAAAPHVLQVLPYAVTETVAQELTDAWIELSNAFPDGFMLNAQKVAYIENLETDTQCLVQWNKEKKQVCFRLFAVAQRHAAGHAAQVH
jgi:hypothetical protein